MVAGWRQHGLARDVQLAGHAVPGELVFYMAVVEFFTHGFDLTYPEPYSETTARGTLDRAPMALPPELRGIDTPFGHIVPVDEEESTVDQLVVFLRRPRAPRQ